MPIVSWEVHLAGFLGGVTTIFLVHFMIKLCGWLLGTQIKLFDIILQKRSGQATTSYT